MRCQNRETPVAAVGCTGDPTLSGPQVVTSTILTFFLYFFPFFARSSIRTACQITFGLIYLRELKHSRFVCCFSLCPHYTISFGFLPSCPASLTAGLLTAPFCRFADLDKDNAPGAPQRTPRRSFPVFFFVFDFARSPTDAKTSRRYCLAGVARRCRATRLRRVYNQGHPRRSCMPCKISCTFTAQLAFSLLRSPLASSKSSRNMDTACTTLGCPVALLVLRLDKASLAQPRIMSLRPMSFAEL